MEPRWSRASADIQRSHPAQQLPAPFPRQSRNFTRRRMLWGVECPRLVGVAGRFTGWVSRSRGRTAEMLATEYLGRSALPLATARRDRRHPVDDLIRPLAGSHFLVWWVAPAIKAVSRVSRPQGSGRPHASSICLRSRGRALVRTSLGLTRGAVGACPPDNAGQINRRARFCR